MGHERTFVGLDVHARSVVACGIDGDTGEVVRARLTPDHEEIWSWLAGLEGPRWTSGQQVYVAVDDDGHRRPSSRSSFQE